MASGEEQVFPHVEDSLEGMFFMLLSIMSILDPCMQAFSLVPTSLFVLVDIKSF